MDIEAAKKVFKEAHNILFFTGAGISVECGIPTFRDSGGIWTKYNPLLWATKFGLFINYYLRFKKFIEFIIDVSETIAKASPSAAPYSVAKAERFKNVLVLTQNIDNLHQEAGSTHVQEIHGNLFEIKRLDEVIKKITKPELLQITKELKSTRPKNILKTSLKEIIDFKLGIRPNVILFNEHVNQKAFGAAASFVKSCDCLIIIGTSLTVYPAAEIFHLATNYNKPIINIGFDEMQSAINLQGKASEILPLLTE